MALTTRSITLVLVLSLTTIGVLATLSPAAEARGPFVTCNSGIDGSTICTVDVANCEDTVVIRPDGRVTNDGLSCIK